jgi:hypothetical protein
MSTDRLDSLVLRAINTRWRSVPALYPGSGDLVVRKWEAFEGLEAGRQDVRLYFDRAMLQRLVDAAESSPIGRVAIHGLQLELEERRASDGHHYIVATFTGVPVPELSGAEQTLIAKR